MMNSTTTMSPNAFHKMVVGIGLAVVFTAGVSAFAMSSRHDSQVARHAPGGLDEGAAAIVAPVPSAPTEMPLEPSEPTVSAPVAGDTAQVAGSKRPGGAAGIARSKVTSRDEPAPSATLIDTSTSIDTSSPAPTAAPAAATPNEQSLPPQVQEAEMTAAPDAVSEEPVASDGK